MPSPFRAIGSGTTSLDPQVNDEEILCGAKSEHLGHVLSANLILKMEFLSSFWRLIGFHVLMILIVSCFDKLLRTSSALPEMILFLYAFYSGHVPIIGSSEPCSGTEGGHAIAIECATPGHCVKQSGA